MRLPLFFLFGTGLLAPGMANAAPLSSILQSASDWNAVQSEAQRQANNDQPAFLSAPAKENIPFYETFEGQWTAPSNASKLAIFSDDGCDVWIDGQKIVALKDVGQALPDLSKSLLSIPFDFKEGHTYTIKVDYSNTVYLGSADIDGVTMFAYTDAVRTWSPSDANGGAVGRGRRPDGSWFDDGRLTAPFDTRTGQSQTVKCGPGGRLNFSAETASDWDAWTDKTRSGAFVKSDYWQDEVVRATWKCDGGKFVVQGEDGKESLVDSVEGQSATWVAWGTSTGTHKVWIEFEDEGSTPPSGDSGTRKDAVLKREQAVEVVSVKLQARRMQSPEESQPDEWSDDAQNAAVIAAGGLNSPEQKAEVRVLYNNAPVTFPIGPVKTNADEAKGEDGPDGVLTMNGAQGEYKSSNVMDALVHLRIEAGSGSPQIGIWQLWGDQYKWDVTPEFTYGQQHPLSFTPYVSGTTKIKGQQVTLAPHEVVFYAWSAEEDDFVAYTFTPTSTTQDKWQRVTANIEITPGTVTSATGVYAAQFKVKYDKQRMIDQIQFSATGDSVQE